MMRPPGDPGESVKSSTLPTIKLKLSVPRSPVEEKRKISEAPSRDDETALRHSLTTAELVDQLFNRTDDLVGLGELVHRVVGQVFAQLEQLTEILPSKEDYERKQLLVKFIEDARKHLVRLLVVTRWSAHARYVKRAQDVLGFLQQQTTYLAGTVDAVEQVRQQLTDVRLRNFDVSTALDVLTTGSFHGAPDVIRQEFAGPERLPDELVELTLLEVEDKLRYRLAVEEDLPLLMRQYTIEDGKAHFVVPALFQVVLTLTGDLERDSWLCLDVEFLPKVAPPGKAMKDEILTLARQKLERPPALPPEDRDRPLRRLYLLLRDVSLDLRLERLAAEASKLALETWRGSLGVTLSRDERSLTVSYWINSVSEPSPRQSQPVNVSKPPTWVAPKLVVSVKERKPTAKAILEAGPDEEPDTDQDLAWMWTASDLPEIIPSFQTLEATTGISDLLDKITRSHTDILCRQVIRELVAKSAPAFRDASRSPLLRDDFLHGFRERLHPSFELDILVDQHSGQFRLRPRTEVSATLQSYIETLEKDVKGSRDRVASGLAQLRALILTEEMDGLANLTGLPVARITSLRQGDIDRLGCSHHCLRLLPLVDADPYYLLAMADPNSGPKFAVAAMAPPSQDIPQWSLTDLAWIRTPETISMTRIKVDQLLDLHRYATVRVAHLRLEQQLASRLLPYERRSPRKAAQAALLSDFPVLAIRSDDLLPGADLVHRVIAIRIEYTSPAKPCSVEFYMRLTKIPAGLAKSLPSICSLDAGTRMVVMRLRDEPDEEGGCALAAFLEVFSTIARLDRPKSAKSTRSDDER